MSPPRVWCGAGSEIFAPPHPEANTSVAVGKEEGDWQGAIKRGERWCKYAEVAKQRIWPLLPDVPENERTVNELYQQIDEVNRIWHTIVGNATGNIFAHGSLVDTEQTQDLQHWLDVAPREFDNDLGLLFTPQPTTRKEILERIRDLISNNGNDCDLPRELAMRMRNEPTTEWTESLRGINNLQALTPVTVVSGSDVLKHFAFLVKPTKGQEKIDEL